MLPICPLSYHTRDRSQNRPSFPCKGRSHRIAMQGPIEASRILRSLFSSSPVFYKIAPVDTLPPMMQHRRTRDITQPGEKLPHCRYHGCLRELESSWFLSIVFFSVLYSDPS